MGLYWEPCPGGARLLRLLGDTPCPAVPGTIEGLPVAELGPYCFADRPVRPGARRTGDDTHEITGNFVEEVTLPDTVRVLDSAAFYNCRRLRRVTLGPGVEGFGSDLFTNCRQLQTFRLRAAADAPTGLKKLLGAVSADITVELDGAQLFYPEYSEFLDENTPAHIFNHSIEGEGYRMRQCFTPGGAVDYAAFDASFAQACVGESEDKLCRLALGRLVQPFGLGDDARAGAGTKPRGVYFTAYGRGTGRGEKPDYFSPADYPKIAPAQGLFAVYCCGAAGGTTSCGASSCG